MPCRPKRTINLILGDCPEGNDLAWKQDAPNWRFPIRGPLDIFEKNPTKIKNFGIWLQYQSRTGYHNMYKEYRDTTLNGAVEQMYIEMASRHRVRFPCIQIIKTVTIPAKLCKRESSKQFHNSKIKFPLVYKKIRPPSRKLKTTYKASRPNLFM
ncbi:hypothetical protein ACJW30_11G045900 [Castanea mollissima]